MKKDVLDMLYKKINGYDVTEVVEEYSEENGELVLKRKKVSTKHIPPDVSLLKLLFELNQSEDENALNLDSYSEQELKQMLFNLCTSEISVKDN